MELQVFYQKRSCNYVRGICVGCQKKSQETDLKTVSVREEEPESTPGKTQEKIPKKMSEK